MPRTFFVPATGISEDVIETDICTYLGPDARYVQAGERNGERGFYIEATTKLTAEMLADLRADSQRWRQERARNPQIVYTQTTTHRARRRSGMSSDSSQPRHDSRRPQAVRSATQDSYTSSSTTATMSPRPPRHTLRNAPDHYSDGVARSGVDSAYDSRPSKRASPPPSRMPSSTQPSNATSQTRRPAIPARIRSDDFDDTYGFRRYDDFDDTYGFRTRDDFDDTDGFERPGAPHGGDLDYTGQSRQHWH